MQLAVLKKIKSSLRIFIAVNMGLIIGLLSEPVVMAQDVQFNLDNEIVWFDDRCIPGSGGGSVKLSGSDNLEKILNFFMQKGLTLAQAAGFVGNMQQESGLEPAIEQGGRIVDENYTPIDGVGFGLVQWTFTARQQPLVDLARDMGQPITSLEVQLENVWRELNSGYTHTLEALRATNDPVEAAVIVHGPPWPGYEASADSPAFVREVRGGFAKEVYDKYKDAEPIGNSTSMPDGETVVDGDTPYNDRMPTIAIDPGHSTQSIEDIDDETGVLMADYSNGQEDQDVFEVALRVKTMLEEEGYNAVMLKNSVGDRVNYRERIGRAEQAGAAMGVSIHTSPNANEVYNQFVGGHRFDQWGNQNNRHEYSNAETASLSTQYSAAMAEGRSEIEGSNVVVKKNNFNGRQGIWGGDLPVISLLSDSVPWVYNEFGGPTSGGGNGISEEEIQRYAEGIVNGIKKTDIKASPGGVDSCGNPNSSAGSGFEATLLGYAWPEPISSGDTNATDTYKTEVIGKAKDNGRYIGGISHPGIDCGGFVTNLLIDSGFEPNYNYGGDTSKGAGPTGNQEQWLRDNWELLDVTNGFPDAADLPQGAVAMQPGHTFVFVGEVEGFSSNVASASLDERAPAAGGNSITEAGVTWYVKK